MELKEKTKNKKQKKVNGKKQFFAGIGVGLLFSVITLILLGMFASCSAKENSSLPIDEIQTINHDNQIQKALPPPNDYDFSFAYKEDEDQLSWFDGTYYDIPVFYSTNGSDYSTSLTLDDLTITITVYQATTSFIYLYNDMYLPSYYVEAIGSTSTNDIVKISIKINNQRNTNLNMYMDLSSNAVNITAFQFPNFTRTDVLSWAYLRNTTLNQINIEAFSQYELRFTNTSGARYLDGLYFKEVVNNGWQNGYSNGLEEGETVAFDQGYDEGYDDGWTGGYGEGYYIGYNDGNNFGYDTGYDTGYANGLEDFAQGGVFPPLTMSFNLINSALGGVLDIFTVEVMPGVSLLSLMLVPLTIALVVMVFRFLRG